jgi:hypothetical protein
MTFSPFDNPLILSFLFHPRQAKSGSSRMRHVTDSAIPVGEDIVLGYRLYAHKPGKPVIVYFHGNGEIAPDYDDSATLYRHAGASLLVIDYRGYGWSTGRPLVSTLLPDVEKVQQALPAILEKAKLSDSPLFVMGRSLGSACAVHWARHFPETLRGIIIESGFARAIPLLTRLGLPLIGLGSITEPMDNISKLREVSLPLLVIHGEEDMLIPVEEGQDLYDASSAEIKRIVRVQGAGHNDLLYYAEEYFAAITTFIEEVISTP